MSDALKMPARVDGDLSVANPQPQSAAIPATVKLAILVAVVGGVLQRTPQILYRPQFWAEDGAPFFRGAYEHPLASIFEPYNGYHLLIPRLIALAAAPLPFRFVPAVYAWLSVAVLLGVSALAMSQRLNLSRISRCIMALAVVLAPDSHEVFSTVTNSQWIIALALVIVASSMPARTHGEKARDVIILLAAGLTGPFSVIFLPLFGLRALRERSRFSILLVALAFICAGVQSAHLPSARIPGTGTWLNPDFIRAFSVHGWNLFFAYVHGPTRWTVSLMLALGTAIVYVAIVWHGVRRPAPGAVTFAVAGLIAFAAALWAYRANPIMITWAGRYLYLPAVTATWAMAALLPSRLAAAGLVLAAASSIAWLAHPSFFIDYHWGEASRCIGVTDPCVIPINPPGWELVIRPKSTR